MLGRKRHRRGISHLATATVAEMTRILPAPSRSLGAAPWRPARCQSPHAGRDRSAARVGELDRTGRAVKQLYAKLLFQRADLVAERRRCHMQLVAARAKLKWRAIASKARSALSAAAAGS